MKEESTTKAGRSPERGVYNKSWGELRRIMPPKLGKNLKLRPPLQQKLGWNVWELQTLATKAGEEPENSCKSWGEHGVHRFLCVSASTPATCIVLALDITQS